MMRCVCSLSRTNMLALFHADARWAYNVWYQTSCFCRAMVSRYISELYMFFPLHWNVSIFSWGYCSTHIPNRWLWCLVRDWRVILVLLSIYSWLLFWWLIFILLFSWILWWRGRIGGQLLLILCDRWGGLCRRRSSFGGRSIALSYRTLPFYCRWNSCIRDDCAYVTRISLGMSGVLRGFIRRVLICLKIWASFMGYLSFTRIHHNDTYRIMWKFSYRLEEREHERYLLWVVVGLIFFQHSSSFLDCQPQVDIHQVYDVSSPILLFFHTDNSYWFWAESTQSLTSLGHLKHSTKTVSSVSFSQADNYSPSQDRIYTFVRAWMNSHL